MKKNNSIAKFCLLLLKNRRFKIVTSIAGATLLLPVVAYLIFEIAYINRVYPNVYIGNNNLSGKSLSESRSVVDALVIARNKTDLNILVEPDGSILEIGKVSDYVSYDNQTTLRKIMSYGREGKLLDQLKLKIWLLRRAYQVSPV
ncbi:MAG: hypothetical protein M3P33_04620, partial [bacterium]|nr:hypothetical protein [bacterium]